MPGQSHLLQMRGLKPQTYRLIALLMFVASFTDAWIETSEVIQRLYVFLSHLLQMRGLKQKQEEQKQGQLSRIFYRCVD